MTRPVKNRLGHDLVIIEWVDSCSPFRKWHVADECKHYSISTCYSVGWLARKDKDSVVIYASIAEEEIGDMTAIPTKAVKSIRRLK